MVSSGKGPNGSISVVYDIYSTFSVGPVDLTEGTSSGAETIPTVTDNLFSQGTITRDVLGVFYAPLALSDSTGSLSFGGADRAYYIGEISFVPLTKTR